MIVRHGVEVVVAGVLGVLVDALLLMAADLRQRSGGEIVTIVNAFI